MSTLNLRAFYQISLYHYEIHSTPSLVFLYTVATAITAVRNCFDRVFERSSNPHSQCSLFAFIIIFTATRVKSIS
jgi:hypothetical protein